MPEDKDATKSVSDLDASMDEGTMRDYEAFCVYSDDSEGQSQEYEIFIVSSTKSFQDRR